MHLLLSLPGLRRCCAPLVAGLLKLARLEPSQPLSVDFGAILDVFVDKMSPDAVDSFASVVTDQISRSEGWCIKRAKHEAKTQQTVYVHFCHNGISISRNGKIFTSIFISCFNVSAALGD